MKLYLKNHIKTKTTSKKMQKLNNK